MNIKTNYKVEVIYPGHLPLKENEDGEGIPWCEQHEEFYHLCVCPKPYSKPDQDGWFIRNEKGTLYASPTEELYDALALWIKVDGPKIRCSRCGVELDINKKIRESAFFSELPIDIIIDKAVSMFFDAHTNCK